MIVKVKKKVKNKAGPNGRLVVEYVPIASLKPWAKNPRLNDETVDSIVKSIEKFGYTNPVLVRRADNRIIAGHTRVKALKQIGETKAPVIFMDIGKTDADLYALFDNKSTENTAWDPPKLSELFVDLKEMGADVEFTGFSFDEISEYTDAGSEPDPADDIVPEPPKIPETKTGDLYILGEHRLLCGDSTKTEDVERLMGGEKADMVFTDPPYGVNYDGGRNNKKKRDCIQGDADTDLYGPCCKQAFEYSSKESVLYLWHAGIKGIAAAAAAAAAGYEIRCELIWHKLKAHYGAFAAQYMQKHEPCYYCYKKNQTANWYGPTNEVTVWEIEQPHINEFHPTQKPTALSERAISNSSKTNNIVLDLFLGSGSTLIAAEKLGRRCFGMEIDPVYNDVILQRWADFTGKDPVRQKDGKKWSELCGKTQKDRD